MRQTWEELSTGVYRCRLAFLDVTVGVIVGRSGVVLVDCGTTLAEARSIADDVRAAHGRAVTHVVLTHDHFDHILGSSVFAPPSGRAEVYGMPAVAATMTGRKPQLGDDAMRYGVSATDVEQALAVLPTPRHQVERARIDLGDRVVDIEHPGRGHTDHDLVVVVHAAPGASDPTVVFCGDLVEQSGDPAVGEDSDVARWPVTLDRVLELGGPDARYVPGHGAVVDAEFVCRQREFLLRM